MFLVLPVMQIACESDSEADATMTSGTSHDAVRPYPLWKNSFGTKVGAVEGVAAVGTCSAAAAPSKPLLQMSNNRYQAIELYRVHADTIPVYHIQPVACTTSYETAPAPIGRSELTANRLLTDNHWSSLRRAACVWHIICCHVFMSRVSSVSHLTQLSHTLGIASLDTVCARIG